MTPSDAEFNAIVNAENAEYPVVYMATIVHRRRGIWLANCSEDRTGVDEWDAYGTLAEAKRWCAEWIGVKRLKWHEHAPGAWIAEHDD